MFLLIIRALALEALVYFCYPSSGVEEGGGKTVHV